MSILSNYNHFQNLSIVCFIVLNKYFRTKSNEVDGFPLRVSLSSLLFDPEGFLNFVRPGVECWKSFVVIIVVVVEV